LARLKRHALGEATSALKSALEAFDEVANGERRMPISELSGRFKNLGTEGAGLNSREAQAFLSQYADHKANGEGAAETDAAEAAVAEPTRREEITDPNFGAVAEVDADVAGSLRALLSGIKEQNSAAELRLEALQGDLDFVRGNTSFIEGLGGSTAVAEVKALMTQYEVDSTFALAGKLGFSFGW
jgi:hypothetical protein